MAIFWRALDWRTYKVLEKTAEDDLGSRELVDRQDWESDFAFSESHRNHSLLARRASAAYILYQARQGYVRPNTTRWYTLSRKRLQPLGKRTVFEALAWIPMRLRLPFAQIIHFALAMLTTRLSLTEVPKPILIDRFKAWIVMDFESFAGNTLGRLLKQWLDEVHERFLKGERVIENFEARLPGEYAHCPEKNWRFGPTDFLSGERCLFVHVADTFDAWGGEYDIGGDDVEAAAF